MRKQKQLLACIEARYGTARASDIRRFAILLGVSEGALEKWIRRERRPRYPMMQKIERVTKGRMSIADW